jgi:hypothetical protein
MRYKVRTLQRKRDHRASAISVGRLWEMNHSSKCVSGTSRRISERPDTGGLTVAALVAYPTRHRKSPISQATHVEQPRAAGVSQPWFPKRNCIAFTVHYGEPSAYQPTAGCARRSWCVCNSALQEIISSAIEHGATRSGRREPTVVPETRLHVIHGTLQRTLHVPTHGGLTLASSHPATFATSCKCVSRTHTWLLSPSGA